jgi:hypothetical protein
MTSEPCLVFASEAELTAFLKGVKQLVEYCTDDREAEDYRENPSENHVFCVAGRVATGMEDARISSIVRVLEFRY